MVPQVNGVTVYRSTGSIRTDKKECWTRQITTKAKQRNFLVNRDDGGIVLLLLHHSVARPGWNNSASRYGTELEEEAGRHRAAVTAFKRSIKAVWLTNLPTTLQLNSRQVEHFKLGFILFFFLKFFPSLHNRQQHHLLICANQSIQCHKLFEIITVW